MKHDPLYYVRFHGLGIKLCNWLYLAALITSVLAYDGKESLMYIDMSILLFFGSWATVEAISAWYRFNWMDSPFNKYPVVIKLMMTLTKDVEEATGIAYNLAVMPTIKANKLYSSWWSEVRFFWIVDVAVTFILYFIAKSIA